MSEMCEAEIDNSPAITEGAIRLKLQNIEINFDHLEKIKTSLEKLGIPVIGVGYGFSATEEIIELMVHPEYVLDYVQQTSYGLH